MTFLSLCGFVSFALAVRIVSPSDCTFIDPSTSHIQLELEVDREEDARFQISVVSSSGAWTFDVPPTPFSKGSLFYFCDGQLRTDRVSCDVSGIERQTGTRTFLVDVPLGSQSQPHTGTGQQFDIQVRPLLNRTVPLAFVLVSAGDLPRSLAQQVSEKRNAVEQYNTLNLARRVHVSARHALRKKIDFAAAFAPGLLEALDQRNRSLILAKIVTKESASGIYSFDLFTGEFSEFLLEEILRWQAGEALVRRPNSTNDLGVVLDDLDELNDFFDAVTRRIVQPLAETLFEEWLNGGLVSCFSLSLLPLTLN
jgi:hypothetical protein